MRLENTEKRRAGTLVPKNINYPPNPVFKVPLARTGMGFLSAMRRCKFE